MSEHDRKRFLSTYVHPQYGARSPLAFWVESVFIAIGAVLLIALLVAMIMYS